MIDVIPTLQTLRPQDVAGRVVVAIDVLRATSTIVAALAAGCREIRPAATPTEARARYRRLAEAQGGNHGLLLGGERMGLRIEGFDLGNSPAEYSGDVVRDKVVFFCTTNGTRTLRRAAGRRGARQGTARPGDTAAPGKAGEDGRARRVLAGAFLNATAVAQAVSAEEGPLVMACAGTRGGFSLEDILLAGFIVDYLERRAHARAPGGPFPGVEFAFRDLARAAAALYRSLAGVDGAGLARAIVSSDHARYLAGLGFADDVALCATLDLVAIVPEYRHGRVVLPGKSGRTPRESGL